MERTSKGLEKLIRFANNHEQSWEEHEKYITRDIYERTDLTMGVCYAARNWAAFVFPIDNNGPDLCDMLDFAKWVMGNDAFGFADLDVNDLSVQVGINFHGGPRPHEDHEELIGLAHKCGFNTEWNKEPYFPDHQWGWIFMVVWDYAS